MKIKLSYKDLVIMLGVLVAAIIVITTFYIREGTSQVKGKTIKSPTTSIYSPAKVLRKIIDKAHLPKHL